jgi:hypothetical protein
MITPRPPATITTTTTSIIEVRAVRQGGASHLLRLISSA